MKKLLGILTICLVGLFMLASCGGSNNSTPETDKPTIDPTDVHTIQLICENSEITLKVKDRYYLVEYFTEEYVAHVEKITGVMMDYNMYVLSWDEDSFKYAEETDPRFCNVYVKVMFILNGFYYIELEAKQDVGLCITPTSTARKVIADVKNSVGDAYDQAKIITTTDYCIFKLPVDEVSYTIK